SNRMWVTRIETQAHSSRQSCMLRGETEQRSRWLNECCRHCVCPTSILRRQFVHHTRNSTVDRTGSFLVELALEQGEQCRCRKINGCPERSCVLMVRGSSRRCAGCAYWCDHQSH